MLRGLAFIACFVSACAAQPSSAPRTAAPTHEPELALSALALSEPGPAAATPRPRRVGRLSPPFSQGSPARNVLARASSEASDRDLAAR